MEEENKFIRFYSITSELGNMVYAGSTERTLKDRYSQHKCPSNNTMSKKLFDTYGFENCKIELIGFSECTRLQRFALEGHYIMKFKKDPLYNCVNEIIPNGQSVGLGRNVSIQGEYNLLNKSNITGVAGVMFHKCSGQWRARISINGKKKELGDYLTFEEAVNARLRAENNFLGKSHNI